MDFSGEGNLTLPHLHWWGLARSAARPGLREGRHATPPLDGSCIWTWYWPAPHAQPAHVCSWFARLTSGALVNSIQARMTQLAARTPEEGWVKLPEPLAERGQLSLQHGVSGARAEAHASPLHTSFSFFPSSPPSRPFPLSSPGVGGCCATSRAAVSRERAISVPGWPTCRRHEAPAGKASQCHPTAREAPHGVVQARIVRRVGRPIKVSQRDQV